MQLLIIKCAYSRAQNHIYTCLKRCQFILFIFFKIPWPPQRTTMNKVSKCIHVEGQVDHSDAVLHSLYSSNYVRWHQHRYLFCVGRVSILRWRVYPCDQSWSSLDMRTWWILYLSLIYAIMSLHKGRWIWHKKYMFASHVYLVLCCQGFRQAIA